MRMLPILLLSILSAACAAESHDESVEAAEAELGQSFRSQLHDLGALPFESRNIHYAEDARPFEEANVSLSQAAGESRYVAYQFDALKGDGLLIAAGKTTASETNGECDEVVRTWLLDSAKRVVRTGTYGCEAEHEVPGLQTKSNILRHYLAKSGSYTLVVAVLPSQHAPSHAAIRTEPWKWVRLDVIRTHKEDQGAAQARCENGVDIYCKPELRCERARCK